MNPCSISKSKMRKNKRILEMFPHGVIIQSQSVLEGIRFTNNEFKDQVQDIKNRISELDNIEVKYAGKEENKDGN